MPAWTRDSGTMARLKAGQPVRIIAIGSFWCPAAFGGPVDQTAEGRPPSSVRYCCTMTVAPTSTRL